MLEARRRGIPRGVIVVFTAYGLTSRARESLTPRGRGMDSIVRDCVANALAAVRAARYVVGEPVRGLAAAGRTLRLRAGGTLHVLRDRRSTIMGIRQGKPCSFHEQHDGQFAEMKVERDHQLSQAQ